MNHLVTSILVHRKRRSCLSRSSTRYNFLASRVKKKSNSCITEVHKKAVALKNLFDGYDRTIKRPD